MVAQQEQLERPHPQPAQDAAPQQQQEPQPGGTPLQLPVRAEVAGFTITAMRRNLEADEANDFFDFDADNPVAVSTGTLLWDASWLIISLLQEDEAQTSGGTPVLPSGLGLRAAIRGRRVLELGSGIGLAGLCCAASGAHVLLSDLPSVVHGILKQNCDANCSSSSSSSSSGAPARPTGSSAPWPGARVCGHGSVGLAPVDFCLPLADQVHQGCDPREAEVVLAADVVWLKELVAPLARTLASVLNHPPTGSGGDAQQPAAPGKVAFLAFGERADASSRLFVHLEEVLDCMRQAGCVAEVALRRTVERDGQRMPVALLRIALVPPDQRV